MPEYKILIVEDEDAISHVIESILSANHYVPLCARSGGQALALANAVQPDLILLDLGLPDMDGVAPPAAMGSNSDSGRFRPGSGKAESGGAGSGR